MIDWHEKVYHSKEGDLLRDLEGWEETRKQVIERDGKCYRCETRQRRHLTVHHILPRREGGKENLENLITLCTRCHDIDNTLEDEEISKPGKTTTLIPDRDETFIRPEWHKWVYGGQRRQT